VFGAAALAQIALGSLSLRQTLAVGMVVAPLGLGLLAAGTWTPDLAMFVVGAVLTGAGAGLVFKGALTTSIGLAHERSRAEVLAGFFMARYVRLAIPVIVLGVIGQVLSTRVEVAGFAGVATGVLVPTVAWLLTRRPGADAAFVADEPVAASEVGRVLARDGASEFGVSAARQGLGQAETGGTASVRALAAGPRVGCCTSGARPNVMS
jgi:hypothetical protein